jgi:flagellar biosynthesis/type III secretory pathway chaperone
MRVRKSMETVAQNSSSNGSSNGSNQGEGLHESLQKLIGLHRQLYELVKVEHEAITRADTQGTYEAVANKEAVIHWIHEEELNRQAITRLLVQAEGVQADEPVSLKSIIIHYQVSRPELTNRLQSDLNALVVLVERIKKQNDLNGDLIRHSLRHIGNMKNNIFGETTHQAKTYNQMGQKNQANSNAHGPRLISKEV